MSDTKSRSSSPQPDPKQDKDIMRASYERETSPQKQEQEKRDLESEQRSMMGAPVDPNDVTTKLTLPPGIDSQDLVDPGRAPSQDKHEAAPDKARRRDKES